MTTIFQKKYDGESLYDLDRDVSEAMMEEYNDIIGSLPVDENGFIAGEFTVTITHSVEGAQEPSWQFKSRLDGGEWKDTRYEHLSDLLSEGYEIRQINNVV